MNEIKILESYEELIRAGFEKEQARAQVYMTYNAMDHLATKSDLRATKKDIMREMEKALAPIHSNIRMIFIFGSLMFTVNLLPYLQKFFIR